MDLTLRTESWGQDDASWLGSSHGTDAGRSITLDTSTFTPATHYPDGYFPSGLPLGLITDGGKYGPYDAAATDGRQVLAGFLLDSVQAPASDAVDVVGALLDHGRVIVAKLPVDFEAPAAASDATTIVYV
ncbi:head decoration protein [Nonomuraea aridisoli]|uniref:Head decoration protein n=1 Tax=Nonomuraea aridisoli TaxID=2070368 RepID=A0A2W2EWE9_9ACTN|nr:head decoration protein [Nonomuraea aridisoli]PZG20605.1 head decoration protein [Nonomuraea aridisoli]